MIYKDYFGIPKNADFQLKNVNYNKTNIIESNLDTSEKNKKMVSFERVKPERILAVLDLITIKITLHNLGMNVMSEKEHEWCLSNNKLLQVYLNNNDEKRTFYTPKYLYKQISYNTVKYESDKESHSIYQNNIGRLYEYYSIQTFPREIRYILFNEEYKDFDIKNAHPTIALDYAEKNDICKKGALQEFVENRAEVLDRVSKELETSRKKTIEDINPKILVLRHLNRTWLKSKTGSETLDKLDTEFEEIRNHLWNRFENGELNEYNLSIQSKQYSTLDDKKVRLSSLYFHTKETEHLCSLTDYLKEEYKKQLVSDNKTEFYQYEKYTDKPVLISAEHGLLTIPFFDGLYITALDKKFHEQLSKKVEDFNEITKKEGSRVEFTEKQIEPNYTYLATDEKTQKKFMAINNWLLQTTNIKNTRLYIDTIPQIQKCLTEITQIAREDPNIVEKITAKNNEIKTYFYMSLLNTEEEFETNDCVSNYISQCINKVKGETRKDRVEKFYGKFNVENDNLDREEDEKLGNSMCDNFSCL